MVDILELEAMEDDAFRKKVSSNASVASSDQESSSNHHITNLPLPEDINMDNVAMDAFPEFLPNAYEKDTFSPDQGTTEDQAEFITHTTTPKGVDVTTNLAPELSAPSPNGVPIPQVPAGATPTPRRPRGNSNDRSRMRAEEICQENINFVCICREN